MMMMMMMNKDMTCPENQTALIPKHSELWGVFAADVRNSREILWLRSIGADLWTFQALRRETMPVWFEHTISMMNGTHTFFSCQKVDRNLQPSKKNLLDRIHFSHGSGVNTCQEKALNTIFEMFVWQLIETISVILSHPWHPSLRASPAGSSLGRPAGVSDWRLWRFEQWTWVDVDVCFFLFSSWQTSINMSSTSHTSPN